jgi:cell division septum initiation protein DivIVA
MQIEPSDFDIDAFPRARVGGLKPEPVEEFLRRVQWSYNQLHHEYTKLKQAAEQAPPHPAATEEPAPAPPAVAQERPPAEPAAEPRQRREPDELARLALAAAHRTARELLDSARQDSELILRKANSRASRIERSFDHLKAAREAELAELDATIADLREQMLSVLRTMLPAMPNAGANQAAAEKSAARNDRPTADATPEMLRLVRNDR